ncbi:MAG: hypothetical protein IPN29_14645 [Saprospiraceae bacterium]|nr:hypothetical protein [Saprospiraceae bacterium]
MSNLTWSREEFICFLLIYTSHVDMDFSNEEKSSLCKKFNTEMFEKQFSHFNGLNDYQALDTILKYKPQYFPSEDQKAELLGKIKEQFLTDGDFSDFEKEIYHFLERML